MRRLNSSRFLLLLLPLWLPVPTTAGGTVPGCPAWETPAEERWAGATRWLALEKAGYRLGEFVIEVRDVYDLEQRPLPWYARAANFIHIDSRVDTIRNLLTIAPGETVNARRVYEAERYLRAQRFLRGAEIAPIACHEDGTVDARVTVLDSWTLRVVFDYRQAGGDTRTLLGLDDMNLLGTGKRLSFRRDSDPERTTSTFLYSDPSLFGSHWRADIAHDSLSDGSGNRGSLRLPFLSIATTYAIDITYEDTTNTLTFYEDGDEAWQVGKDTELQDYRFRHLVFLSGDNGWRAGLGWRHEAHRYDALMAIDATLRPPPALDDRTFAGPYVSLERFHDHFQSFRNLRLMDRVEDYNLGLDARLLVGRYLRDAGSSREATFLEFDFGYGARLGEYGLLLLTSENGARRETSGWRDGSSRSTLNFYYQRQPAHSVLARLRLDWHERPDPEDEVHLGGMEGLFAYPTFFRAGTRAWQVHLEDRRITERVLFNTLRVGYTTFVEAGRIRRVTDERWSRTYADAGFGFRFGNLRGAFGQTLYLTVAVPLVKEPGVEPWSLVLGEIVEF
ncbi:MAG TPA: hypothetical protein VNL72_05550 [Gammaproteobacteria bacterium]|nr:hypothetical protein [Gammaproteobacteria bacterium]